MKASLRFTVGDEDTAAALGSGDLPVLGTPRLLAWSEAATCAAIADRLQPGETSVGTRVDLDHVSPSPVGATVRVTAAQLSAEGRCVRFQVTASSDPGGQVVGHGEITRVVVDAERFLSRAQ